jgi:Papain family cysteine protease
MSLIRVVQSIFGKKNYGYLPDPKDSRDLMLSAHLGTATAPPSASVRSDKIIVKDQKSTSSCTGQGTSQAVRLAYLKQGIDCPDLSALFPYDLGRSLEGSVITDSGAVIRDVISAGIKWGFADESAWPFLVSKVNTHPSIKAYNSAYDRRGAHAYYRINSGDVNGVRLALAAGYPVVAGWNLSQSFEDWNGKGVIGAQKAPFLGGHCMCIDAYAADKTFELVNSWGTSWGRGGFATVTEGFMAQASDIWAIRLK